MKNIEQTNTLSRYVGQLVRRQEDFKFITGHAQYVDDISPRHMLSVAILRSPYAHALVKSIDVEKARALSGVVAIYTGADLKEQVKSCIKCYNISEAEVCEVCSDARRDRSIGSSACDTRTWSPTPPRLLSRSRA